MIFFLKKGVLSEIEFYFEGNNNKKRTGVRFTVNSDKVCIILGTDFFA